MFNFHTMRCILTFQHQSPRITHPAAQPAPPTSVTVNMSTITAAHITETLSHYDALIRQALELGNVQAVMSDHGDAIVSGSNHF